MRTLFLHPGDAQLFGSMKKSVILQFDREKNKTKKVLNELWDRWVKNRIPHNTPSYRLVRGRANDWWAENCHDIQIPEHDCGNAGAFKNENCPQPAGLFIGNVLISSRVGMNTATATG